MSGVGAPRAAGVPPDAVDAAVAALRPRLPLGVALSGGADSTALLVACARRWPGQLVALHVNHGLQAAADAFERHCAALCERWQVPLRVGRIDARPRAGESPEEAARLGRYRALAELAGAEGGFARRASAEAPASTEAATDGTPGALQDIVLGHHADDQVETLILALSRGAGLPGLAAMPRTAERAGLRWHRPLLDLPAHTLRAWLRSHGEGWIDDPTNTDARYTRNRIRQQVLPALADAFPQFRQTFARSARHAAQAQELLADIARADLAETGIPPRIRALQALPRSRQANALRAWLAQASGRAPAARQIDELLDQIAACTTRGHRIHLKAGSGQVVREGDTLRWYNGAPLPKPPR
ncbi:tRNA lysidine(34) synthetase TilS [uncultured Pseudacidovorax sp.]|uniref:tRNA lysidine(34) synthetase TilS n=1 Tax=uncultured Pseudacidovorax sp. TaxID=679313 RepID=UPI0025FDDEC1|nr:tRNA lysidine(34) synthetase TilS [uncultured Pseudacidovorax sp.]